MKELLLMVALSVFFFVGFLIGYDYGSRKRAVQNVVKDIKARGPRRPYYDKSRVPKELNLECYKCQTKPATRAKHSQFNSFAFCENCFQSSSL